MPTYVYGCDACSHRFEVFQKFQDAPLTECPECGQRIRRILQPAGIVFKGSGWYSTDSRSGKESRKSSDDATAETPAKSEQSPSASNGESAGKKTKSESDTSATPAAAKAAD